MADEIYLLPVDATIKESWNKVSGSKATFWAAIGIVFLITIGLTIIEAIIKPVMPTIDPLLSFIIQFISFIFQMGILYMGIRRAFDTPINYRDVFYAFQGPVLLKVVILYILQILIFLIPGILAAVGFVVMGTDTTPGLIPILLWVISFILIVYLAMCLYPSMAFVLDKGISPVEAIKQSFKATRGNIWRLIWICILQIFIIIVSIIPIGIGLIWGLPLVFIMYGAIYKNLLVNVRSNQ